MKQFTLYGLQLHNTKGVDMSLLPPCRFTCKRLVQRTNYQTLIWKNSHAQFPEIPDPKSHGWKENELGNLDYDWCEGPIIPQVSRFTCIFCAVIP